MLDSFLDLKNQNSLDAAKLARITEYEHRIQALTKTLAIWCVIAIRGPRSFRFSREPSRSDADLVKFVDQRKEMNLLVGEYKKSEYLREAVEAECKTLKESLRSVTFVGAGRAQWLTPRARSMENELVDLRRRIPSSPAPDATTLTTPTPSKDELALMRQEMERLRARNAELEERLADVLDEELEDEPVRSVEEVTSGADTVATA